MKSRERTMPTIAGLAILVFSTFAGLLLTSRQTSFFGKASGDCKPLNLQVSNVSHYSFNLSFTTNSQCLANISVNNQNLSDIRFVNSQITDTPSLIHYFEVTGLKENTQYPYTLIINGKKYTNDNYKITTATKPALSVPVSQLAWGRVYTADLKPAKDTIVFLTIPGASLLSSYVTSKGHWNISLATSFNEQKNNWFKSTDNQEEEIVVLASDGSTTRISSNTSRNNPVPDIILGQNTFASKPVEASIGGDMIQDAYTNNTSISETLTIDNPKENEAINTPRPDVFGLGPANTQLIITHFSNTYRQAVQSDGRWHWSPTTDLPLGENKLSVSTGSLSVTRTFKVENNTGGLAFSASDSAQTVTPTIIPTAIPTIIITPTIAVTPTAISTVTPTIRASRPSTSSGVPVSGTTLPTILIVILSTIFIGFSLLFFKTR